MSKRLIQVSIVLWSIVLIASIFVFVKCAAKNGIKGKSFEFNFSLLSGRNGPYVVAKDITIDSKIKAIEIDWISGDLSFFKSQDEKIRIIQMAGENFPKNKLFTYTVTKEKLKLTDERKNTVQIGIFSNNPSNLQVFLPERLWESLEFNTVSSNISFENLNSEIIYLNTISGTIEASGESPELSIKTISGNVLMKGSFNELDINTISGRVKATTSIPLTSIKSNSISGDVTVVMADNDGFTLDFTKVSGRLEADFPLSIKGNKHIYKNGDAKYSVNTVSGAFAIQTQ
jgi:DUF4097 and DUF4098 domain-containing protein YvlB